MSGYGIFAGSDPVDVQKWEKVQGSEWAGVHEGVLPMDAVHVGSERIWPTYQEQFHWYEWETPGYVAAGAARQWQSIQVPAWCSAADVVIQAFGGRGEDGSRGFGNNDGRGGFTSAPRAVSLPMTGTSLAIDMARPSSYGELIQNTFVYVIADGVPVAAESTLQSRSGSGSTGASGLPLAAFGRSFPGGAGGARDQPGQPYGGAGGGGIGAPPIGGDRRNGQYGATGFVALRLRSGPVPDGHTWPENPDWANPQ